MPPEQARGAPAEIGPASDVYALGAVLHEILCGSAPYTGRAAAVLSRLLDGPPEALAARVRSQVSLDLVTICERAMARAPSDRPADAGALAEEVRRFLDGARRRERALALVREARALAPEIDRLRARAAALHDEARAVLAGIQTSGDAEEKARGWSR